MPMHRPLRFAILCNGTRLEAWQAKCLGLLLASECAQLVLVVTNAEPAARHAMSSLRPNGGRRHHLLWGFYGRYFARRAFALKPVDCSLEIASADQLECAVFSQGPDLQCFHDRDIAKIRSYQLDFILRFGFGLLKGDILTAAKYGVWSYDHDHDPRITGIPTCFWGVIRGHRTTDSILRRLAEQPDRGAVLHRATFATHWHFPTSYDQVAFGSADGCLRVCRAILAGDDREFEVPVLDGAAHAPAIPSNLQVITFVLNQVTGYLHAKFEKLFCRDEWNVGIVAQPVEALLHQGLLSHVSWLGDRTGDTYLADPIVLDPLLRCRFLAERFEYGGSAKGSIVRCDFEADGRLSVVPYLDADHHLSYPFVLHHENSSYLIPETSELGAVFIYPICGDGALGPATRLLDGVSVVDATVFWSNQRWWLFCSEGSLKLLAFYADALDGPWTPHWLNPLKTDVTSCRPAGPLFERDGVLFRPAQDCSGTYGAAVVLHRIVELTPERFHEERLGRIGPEIDGPYPDGFHTINVMGERCLVDGKRIVFDPTWIFRGRTHGRKVRARLTRLRATPPPGGDRG